PARGLLAPEPRQRAASRGPAATNNEQRLSRGCLQRGTAALAEASVGIVRSAALGTLRALLGWVALFTFAGALLALDLARFGFLRRFGRLAHTFGQQPLHLGARVAHVGVDRLDQLFGAGCVFRHELCVVFVADLADALLVFEILQGAQYAALLFLFR